MDHRHTPAAPDSPHLSRRLGAYVGAVAVASAVLGCAVIVAWVVDLEVVERVRPGLIAMSPTTALAFMVAGASLWLRRSGHTDRLRKRLGMCAAALVLTIGAIKLAEYATGGQFGLDRLLLHSGLAAEVASVKSAIALNTAAACILIGAALLLLDIGRPGRWRPAEVLAVAAAGIAMLACIGHLYGVEPQYGVATLVPMALNTAVGLVVLSSGVLAAREEHAIVAQLVSARIGGVAARRLIPGAVCIILVAGWLRLKGEQLGVYETEFGVALMSAVTVFLIFGLTWSVAVSLDRAQVRHEKAENDVRRTHAELIEKGELLRTILDSVGDGIIVTDRSGSLLASNPAADRLLESGGLGGCSAQWYGHANLRLPDGFTPIPPEELALPRACGGEAVRDQEQYIRGESEGETRWLSVSAEPLRDDRGDAAVVVMRDITARKLIERRLEGQKEALEVVVASRTAELRRSNDELRQFAYVASHDLQEPLRMVASYLQLIQRRYEGRLDEDGKEFIGYAVDGANRMKQLINDLLQFSRVERKTGARVETDAREAVEGALVSLGAAVAEADARLTIGPMPRVGADPVQLRQLFQNLIGNAIKFRGESPPEILVSAEPAESGWVFSVADNGIGIEPQYCERVFEIFQRLHDRSKYPGTGIGLAICKKIVERHGGRIWAEPRPGGGSVFLFTISPMEGAEDGDRIAA